MGTRTCTIMIWCLRPSIQNKLIAHLGEPAKQNNVTSSNEMSSSEANEDGKSTFSEITDGWEIERRSKTMICNSADYSKRLTKNIYNAYRKASMLHQPGLGWIEESGKESINDSADSEYDEHFDSFNSKRFWLRVNKANRMKFAINAAKLH